MPIGAEVQVLQPCVLQTDVLQDVPRTLTPWREAETDAATRKDRENWQREKSMLGTEEGSLSLANQHTQLLLALWNPNHCSALR